MRGRKLTGGRSQIRPELLRPVGGKTARSNLLDGLTIVIQQTTGQDLPSMPDGAEIAATVRTLELAGVTVATVRNGKFETMREYFDSAALMSQLSG